MDTLTEIALWFFQIKQVIMIFVCISPIQDARAKQRISNNFY